MRERLRRFLFFSWRELALVLAVGLVTGILDDHVEAIEFAAVARTHLVVLLNDYLQYVTGGPIFGDLLEMWLEFGGVLAACLVRKPAAGTLALTVNGLCQVFVNGSHDPHLLYGVPGLGADVVFAFFSYKRYDWVAIALAGVACATFWYPIVWFTHGLYLYPLSFLLPDLALRALGGALGDGLLAGFIAFALVRAVGRRWGQLADSPWGQRGEKGLWNMVGFLVASLAVFLVALTHASPSLSNFFSGIGPKIPAGLATLEEYNPGYVLGVDVVFLVLVMLAFWNLGPRLSGDPG